MKHIIVTENHEPYIKQIIKKKNRERVLKYYIQKLVT